MRLARALARTMVGGIVSIMLVVAALWAWGHAPQLADNAHRPEVLAWAVRCAAVALLTGAQVVLMTMILGAIYPRRALLDDVMRLTAALVCTLAVASAIALALAER